MGRASCVALVTFLMALSASCSRESGETVAAGEMVLVRLNVTGDTVLVGFMMCDELACSKIELWGVSAKHALSFKTFVDCGANGYGGVSVSQSSTIDRQYPSSVVVVVSRYPDKMSLWLHDVPEAAVTLATARGQMHLYVKDHWDSNLSPGNVTIEFLEGGLWRRECRNGGWYNGTVGECSCPPGFGGPSCEKACGPDRYGSACAKLCSGTARGCRGRKVDWNCADGPTCWSCAAGLHGSLCDKVCRSGQYGSDCLQRCGMCDSTSACDVYTGQCPAGCATGFHGPSCHEELTHLNTGPNITMTSATSFSGHFTTSSANLDGSGTVMYYEVQFKEMDEIGGGQWVSATMGCLGNLCSDPAESPNVPSLEINFTVDGLKQGQDMAVRVLLLDQELRGFTDVPYVRIRTLGRRPVSDLTVFEVTSNGAKVAWTSNATENRTFVVQYMCVKLLACPVSCYRSSEKVFVTGNSVSLTKLLPGALYNVLVATPQDELQGEQASVVTKFAVPDARIESVAEVPTQEGCNATKEIGPGVVSRTSTSATVRWMEPQQCVHLNGVLVGYRWQLISVSRPNECPHRSSTTRSTSVTLDNLEPDTRYELRVFLQNVEGFNPSAYVSIPFTTCRNDSAQLSLDVEATNHRLGLSDAVAA